MFDLGFACMAWAKMSLDAADYGTTQWKRHCLHSFIVHWSMMKALKKIGKVTFSIFISFQVLDLFSNSIIYPLTKDLLFHARRSPRFPRCIHSLTRTMSVARRSAEGSWQERKNGQKTKEGRRTFFFDEIIVGEIWIQSIFSSWRRVGWFHGTCYVFPQKEVG